MTQSARLEVHFINVGQGDSILIVNRDLDEVAEKLIDSPDVTLPDEPIDYVPYAVAQGISLRGTVVQALLIDGGEDYYGGDVVAYLERHGVVEPGIVYTPHLSVLLSHYHADHIAGLRSVFKQLDPLGGGEVERYRPGTVYRADITQKQEPKTIEHLALRKSIREASTQAVNPTRVVTLAAGGLHKEVVPPAVAPLSIDLGTGAPGLPIVVHVMAAAQGVFVHGVGVRAIPSKNKNKIDYNDRSIVLVLEYGSFRCLLGGDIAGNGAEAGGNVGTDKHIPKKKKKQVSTAHADVETALREALRAAFPKTATHVRVAGQPKYPNAGCCTVVKASHHGSGTSNDANLLATTQPVVFVFSSGMKTKFHHHPTQANLNRLARAGWFLDGSKGPTADNVLEGIYATEVADKVNGTTFTVDIGTAVILGDIVVRPVDESLLAIQATGVDQVPLDVQVYGTGAQTGMDNPAKYALRDTGLTEDDLDKTYPTGPFINSRDY